MRLKILDLDYKEVGAELPTVESEKIWMESKNVKVQAHRKCMLWKKYLWKISLSSMIPQEECDINCGLSNIKNLRLDPVLSGDNERK